jgi:exodeoxyribonuclease VII small subunit
MLLYSGTYVRVKGGTIAFFVRRRPPRFMLPSNDSPLTFESALTELEALVATMEAGQLPLKESLAAYKRGAELLAFCQTALREAQLEVEVLEKGVLKAFRPDSGNDA